MTPTRIFDILEEQKKYPKPDIFANRTGDTWRKFSTQDYYDIAHTIAYALLEMGLQKGDKVATIMNNRAEWNFMDMGIMLANMVHVPIYATLNEKEYKHILNHCDCKIVVTGVEAIYKKVEPILHEVEQKPEVFTIDVIEGKRNYQEIIDLGKTSASKWYDKVEENKKTISTEELATIIYTSGTTGNQKGVMLSHKNLCNNFMPLTEMQTLDHNAKLLSFLPLCHVYERTVCYHYQFLGASYYYAGGLGTIAKDIHDMKADGFCSVPRVLEMMFDKLYSVGKDLKGIKRMLYFWAFRVATKYDNYNKNWFYLLKIKIADQLVYSKWRAKMSGKEMIVVSGGSAIQARIIRLFTAAQVRVYEGYGLTETSPVIAVNNPKKRILKPGTVGEIMPGIEFKLADDGEILTKGHCLMMGYYKDPEYTKQVIDEDGWFHTGDIGTMVEGKFLQITDRKKEIFKLSLGKYIAPQMIENKLKESTFINNVMVIGENEKFASAIIVPDMNALHFWCAKHRVHFENNKEMITLPEVLKRIQREVDKINAQLSEHEQIKRFRLIADEWSPMSGELSQTLKLKRAVIYRKYDALCREIYNYDLKV
ncbi:MAG: long-chain fatty acid--CoA ligase [Bacteroidetes bacterium]|nr:long-chain fatty acid--CoA ligase [Bacteroidota bacterium]MCL1968064.1 long-chain fatty acid--CoA ligase [Bacteroidota bacterium]